MYARAVANGPLHLPLPPARARTVLGIVETPAGPGVSFTWATVGGPALPVLLLVMRAPFVAVAAFILAAMIATRPAGLSAWHILFIGGILAGLLFLVAVVIDAWRFSTQVLTVTPVELSYRRSSPLLDRTMGIARLLLRETGRTWAIPLGEFAGVRVVDDDQLHLRTKGQDSRVRICIVHLPSPDEPAWIAQYLRDLARALGPRAAHADQPN
jgi:hypothetical protein